MPLLDLATGPGLGSWPGNGNYLSKVFDVADMLPAIRTFGSLPAEVFTAGEFTLTDPRFVVDWHMALGTDAVGVGATDAFMVFSLTSGTGPSNALTLGDVFKIGLYGTCVPIDYGGDTTGIEVSNYALHGTVKITGRYLQARVRMFSAVAPAFATCGAYLRIV